MKLLLDTHSLLWFFLGNTALSEPAKQAILDPNHEKLVSPASYRELAIKISLGKYTLHHPFEAFWSHGLMRTGFQVLQIEVRHAAIVATLPFHHRDPFDRMLIAQATADNLTIVSGDKQFDSYSVPRIW